VKNSWKFWEETIKSSGAAGYWWLTPIIIAIQETEIRRDTVQSQPL
jgi:hypothetical protein